MKQNTENIKIAFLGTPDIAAIVLEDLVKHKFNIIGVFCSPDKVSGRGNKKIFSPVKSTALKFKLSVFQPNTKEELTSQISKLNPDLAIVFAYGIILQREAIELPKFKTINIHPSLLPKYRGPSPIASAILEGERETGVSIIRMTEKVDAGPILAQKKIKISEQDNPETLGPKIAKVAADILIDLIPRWVNGEVKEIPQDDKKATHARIFKKDDGHIDWSRSAKEISDQVRAFTPWPGSFTYWDKQLIKVVEAEAEGINSKHKIGEVFFENKLLKIKTGDGNLVIKKLKLAGKKEVTGDEFVSGYPKIIGSVLN